MGNDAPMTSAARRWAVWLLLASALLPYAGTRLYDHVHDDHVVRGPGSLATSPDTELGDLLRADFFGTPAQLHDHTGFWRPLALASFRLEARLAGGSMQGFLWLGHVVTVLCHLAATLALWRLLLALGVAPGTAVLAAGVFGLHPVHVECVAWTSGRVDSVACALAWGGTTLWLRARGRGAAAAGAALLLVAAPLSKEAAVLLLALAPVAGRALGFSWPRALAVPGLALLATVALRGAVFGFEHAIPEGAYTGPADGSARWATWLSILPDHLRLLVWPGTPTPLHPVAEATGLASPGVAAGLVVLVGALAVTGWLLRHGRPATAYVAALLVGALLLVAPWARFPIGFPDVAGPLYERYLYAAAAAPALALATLLARVVGTSGARTPVLLAVLVAALSPVTAARAYAWSSDVAFARAALTVAPGSADLWSHLGTALLESARTPATDGDRTPTDDLREAVEAFDRALALDEGHVRAGVNRFIARAQLGLSDEAAGDARWLLARWPDVPLVLHNVAAWHEGEGRVFEAAVLFKQELDVGDAHPETAERLARLEAILEQRARGEHPTRGGAAPPGGGAPSPRDG